MIFGGDSWLQQHSGTLRSGNILSKAICIAVSSTSYLYFESYYKACCKITHMKRPITQLLIDWMALQRMTGAPWYIHNVIKLLSEATEECLRFKWLKYSILSIQMLGEIYTSGIWYRWYRYSVQDLRRLCSKYISLLYAYIVSVFIFFFSAARMNINREKAKQDYIEQNVKVVLCQESTSLLASSSGRTTLDSVRSKRWSIIATEGVSQVPNFLPPPEQKHLAAFGVIVGPQDSVKSFESVR